MTDDAATHDIPAEFVRTANGIVWCSVATVDARGRPRQRVLHPIWRLVDGRPVGWVLTLKTGLTAKHMADNPHLAVSYWSPSQDAAYADCVGSWVEERDERRDVFHLFNDTTPPLGYDLSALGDADHPLFTPLRLDPWRVQVFDGADFPPRPGVGPRSWRAPSSSSR